MRPAQGPRNAIVGLAFFRSGEPWRGLCRLSGVQEIVLAGRCPMLTIIALSLCLALLSLNGRSASRT